MLPPDQRLYKGVLDCYRKTVARESLRGLWTGWGPNVTRNAMMNGTEVSSYDQAK